MNYKALEDLINILVKKAGYNVTETKTSEDIEELQKRLTSLEEAKEKLERKISSDNYINKDEKNKDLEEKKYIESSINILTSQADKGLIVESELESLNEQARILDLKIENRTYEDRTSKAIDDLNSKTIEEEIDKVSAVIKEKHDSPSELGQELLKAFKAGKTFDQIRPMFEKLINLATDENKKTVEEIDNTNIFELMEKYAKEKDSVSKRIQKGGYSTKDVKNGIDEKKKYHSKKITSYNKTLDAIETRKKELKELVEESKELYAKTREERIKKEELLNEYTEKLYSSREITQYMEEFNKYLDYLKDEILGNKILEDKYTSDVIMYNDEIRTLELNIKTINGKILDEENCLEVVESKMEALEDNCLDRIDDELSYLYNASRLESLTNEQQYFYVNVDTIKTEIANIWNKGNNSDSYESSYTSYLEEKEEEEKPEEEEVEETTTEPVKEDNDSMYEEVNYEEPVRDTFDDEEIADSIDDLIAESDDDDDDDSEFGSDVEVYETLE